MDLRVRAIGADMDGGGSGTVGGDSRVRPACRMNAARRVQVASARDARVGTPLAEVRAVAMIEVEAVAMIGPREVDVYHAEDEGAERESERNDKNQQEDRRGIEHSTNLFPARHPGDA
jgi:hypothetical protein